VVASFAIDLVFLGGVAGDEGQKAAGVVVVLLLWRIARVVDGKHVAYFHVQHSIAATIDCSNNGCQQLVLLQCVVRNKL